MAFFKDKIGLYLFLFSYIALFIQVITVYLSRDDTDINSYLFYHKFYFYFLTVMTVWCHIKCAVTDPGKISHKTNPAFVEFYLNIHELGIKRAEKFNESYGEMFFKNMGEEEEKEDDEDVSDYDESHFEPVTSITDETMDRLSSEYKVQLKRCQQCYVVRPPRVHHCSICKGCIMKMDHHCPWINNCIGQFTQKFFILLCGYSFCGCCETIIIVLYYMVYKSHMVGTSWKMIMLIFFQMFFAIVFIIFTVCMLNEQWNIIQNDTMMIDIKKKKFTEKRDLNEVMNETFGKGFDLGWFLPIKVGGYRPFFFKLLKGRRRS